MRNRTIGLSALGLALIAVATLLFLLGLYQTATLPIAEGLPIPGISG